MSADEETQITDGVARHPDPSQEFSGSVPECIGRYRVIEPIGQGGMGRVFAAWDERLERAVAIKVLPDTLAADGSARARFWREARALAALDHPGIVRVFDFGETEDGTLYLVMERVFGEPLAAQRGGVDTVADAIAVLRAIAEALACAHEAGIVHRDLKPTNLLRGDQGTTKVIDFGIARTLTDANPTLTATGAAIGSPAYMSPEQVRGEAIGSASDIFSLGIVLFELLAGRRPFTSPTPYATAIQIADAQRPSIASLRPDLPTSVVALVEDMLAPGTSHRPQDASALAHRLRELDDDALDALPLGLSAEPAAATTLHATAEHTPRANADTLTPAPAAPAHPHEPSPNRRVQRRPRVRTFAWALAACLGLVAIVGLLERRNSAPEREPNAPTDAFAYDALQWPDRPPRPFIALEVVNAEGETSPVADVVEYAARARLDGAPDAWLVLADDASPSLWQRSLGAPAARDVALRLDARILVEVQRSSDRVHGAMRTTFANGASLPAVELPAAATALEMADRVAEATHALLGASAPLAPHPTRSEEAIAALVSARTDWSIGTEDRGALVRLAVDRDPLFGDALLERAEMMRTDRILDSIPATVAPGIASPTTPERTRALLRGIAAIGQDDPAEAYRAFTEVLDRWRFDRIAIYLTIALTHHGGPADPVSDARLALRLLEVDPTDEVAISRYIRSGQWASADALRATLHDLGVYDALGEERTAIDAEFGLATGDFEGAAARFGVLLESNPASVYALHQQAAAWILAGSCPEAIASMYAWIDAQEARGHGGNLGWSYSLAFQALVCEAQWEPALAVLDRWERYDPEHHEIVENRRLVAWASTSDTTELASTLADELRAQATLTVRSVTLLHLLSLIGEEPGVLRELADRARRSALDLDLRRDVQRGLAEVAVRLDAFATLRETPCNEAGLTALRDARRDARDDTTERGSHYRVDGWFAYAAALDACARPDEARDAYQRVVDAGYARLYRTVLYEKARARLAVLRPTGTATEGTP